MTPTIHLGILYLYLDRLHENTNGKMFKFYQIRKLGTIQFSSLVGLLVKMNMGTTLITDNI